MVKCFRQHRSCCVQTLFFNNLMSAGLPQLNSILLEPQPTSRADLQTSGKREAEFNKMASKQQGTVSLWYYFLFSPPWIFPSVWWTNWTPRSKISYWFEDLLQTSNRKLNCWNGLIDLRNAMIRNHHLDLDHSSGNLSADLEGFVRLFLNLPQVRPNFFFCHVLLGAKLSFPREQQTYHLSTDESLWVFERSIRGK